MTPHPIVVTLPAVQPISVSAPDPSVDVSVAATPSSSVAVNNAGISSVISRGDAVTLFFREEPNFTITSAFQNAYSETWAAGLLSNGKWMEVHFSGRFTANASSSLIFTVFFGGATFDVSIPLGSSSFPDGRWFFHARIYSDTQSRQIWHVSYDAKDDGSIDGDASETIPVERVFHTNTNSSLAASAAFGVNFTSASSVGVVSQIAMYHYDREGVQSGQPQGSGLTAADRVKLDSIEHDAEVNRPLHKLLWSFQATDSGSGITNISSPPGDPIVTTADWFTVRKGILPRVSLGVFGGLIRFHCTGFTQAAGGTGDYNVELSFRFLANGEVLNKAASTPIVFTAGSTVGSNPDQMLDFADFVFEATLYFGSLSNRNRMAGVFSYLNKSFPGADDVSRVNVYAPCPVPMLMTFRAGPNPADWTDNVDRLPGPGVIFNYYPLPITSGTIFEIQCQVQRGGAFPGVGDIVVVDGTQCVFEGKTSRLGFAAGESAF
jgi:hypothetical protein